MRLQCLPIHQRFLSDGGKDGGKGDDGAELGDDNRGRSRPRDFESHSNGGRSQVPDSQRHAKDNRDDEDQSPRPSSGRGRGAFTQFLRMNVVGGG